MLKRLPRKFSAANPKLAFLSLKSFLTPKDKKASLGLAAENFLGNRFNIHTVLNSPQFSQVSDVFLYNRGFRLTFSYKIGKMSAMEMPRKKGKSVNNDDIKTDGNGQNTSGGVPGGGQNRQ